MVLRISQEAHQTATDSDSTHGDVTLRRRVDLELSRGAILGREISMSTHQTEYPDHGLFPLESIADKRVEKKPGNISHGQCEDPDHSLISL